MTEQTRPFVQIYTDGACDPNPGIGGWAAILVSTTHDGHSQEVTGAEPQTTNNRMELSAAIGGLAALERPCVVELSTDSQYVQRAFSDGWLANWKRNGWRTSARKQVLNDDLWRELDRLCGMHDVTWKWVRGHAGHPENTRADRLAVEARQALRRRLQSQRDG
jgi:ribonuclease HI